MKKLLYFIGILLLAQSLSAQKYSAKNGFVGFFSHTPIEDIKADNNQVASIIDVATGEIVFQVLIRSFHFEKALMEEHFNENYLESEVFPKSTFKGKITNLSEIDFSTTGIYKASIDGEMNIHGVSKQFSTQGTIEVTGEGLVAGSKFSIIPEDYGITIPNIVRDNIARELEVTVNIKYSPLNK